MSNVVEFLESLARQTSQMSRDAFVLAVRNAGLAPVIEKALLERDVDALAHELNARRAMFCAVFPADNDEPGDSEEREESPEAPEQDTTSRAA